MQGSQGLMPGAHALSGFGVSYRSLVAMRQMDMGVDQAWQDGLPIDVDGLGPR
jgi:hypothetical protein